MRQWNNWHTCTGAHQKNGPFVLSLPILTMLLLSVSSSTSPAPPTPPKSFPFNPALCAHFLLSASPSISTLAVSRLALAPERGRSSGRDMKIFFQFRISDRCSLVPGDQKVPLIPVTCRRSLCPVNRIRNLTIATTRNAVSR